ncbi:MAG: metalloregulator ArsR/SmtB family transcription factor [Pseudomonadota bacterium]
MNGSGKKSDGQPEIMADETFAAMCKALGHPARVKILKHLLEVDGCVCGRIVEIMPLAQSTVSQHLKSLKQAGLVGGMVEGPAVCYCVDRAALEKFINKVRLLGLREKEDE